MRSSAMVTSISTRANHSLAETTITIDGHVDARVGDLVFKTNEGITAMDPLELELNRLRENNVTMADFIKSAGMANAYDLYLVNLGKDPVMQTCYTGNYQKLGSYSKEYNKDTDGN